MMVALQLLKKQFITQKTGNYSFLRLWKLHLINAGTHLLNPKKLARYDPRITVKKSNVDRYVEDFLR